MKLRFAFAACAVLAGCGGSQPAAPPPASPAQPPPAHPVLPPSMATPGSPDMPAANTPTGTLSDADQGVEAVRKGDIDTAKAIYKKMHDRDPKDAEAMHLLGLIDEKQGNPNGAERAYRDAIKARPDLVASYVDLSALLLDQQRNDDALAVARAGLAKSGNDPSLHTNAAIALGGKGDVAAATKEFETAVRAAPEDPMLLFTYGHWLAAWKQRDAALEKLRAARPLAKDDVGILAAIGHEMHVLGAFADCVPTFDRAIALKDAAELRTERASCKLAAKDDAGALADLRAATTSQPQYAPAHFYLARALAESGDWAGAASEYEAFLKLEPNSPTAKVARERLKQAKEHLKR